MRLIERLHDWLYGNSEPSPDPRMREASHHLSSEVVRLRATLEGLQESDEALQAWAESLRKRQYRGPASR